MGKFKYLVFDPDTMTEPIKKETLIDKHIVKSVEEQLKSIQNLSIIGPMITEDLNVKFGIVEDIDNKQTLTYYIHIKPNKI